MPGGCTPRAGGQMHEADFHGVGLAPFPSPCSLCARRVAPDRGAIPAPSVFLRDGLPKGLARLLPEGEDSQA